MKILRAALSILVLTCFFSCGKDESLDVKSDDAENNQNFVSITNGESTEKSSVTNNSGVEPASKDNKETVGSVTCYTKGGMGNTTGLKVWCWGDIEIPEYSSKVGVPFSNGQLKINSECYEKQVSKDEGFLKFSINPTYPEVGNWCSNAYNMRAEISTEPWKVNHPIGTEEWFGWSYTFGKDYIIDKESPWAFFQVHEGTAGKTPLIAMWSVNENGAGSGSGGEILVVNNSTDGKSIYYSTGIIPKASQTLDIVMHVIWGDENSGMLQVWIDGAKVVDKQERTVRASNPVGGNAKWGIYKWPWRNANNVQKSRNLGISKLETYMGPLRIITRKPDDLEYKKNSYSVVAPR
ncbi:heparin lyase I family protein [uncultured Zobellia sp.]|uniref:heparin lyase I family protein n=1 Tax=uncultured Zobellia sp. TaxID=255433 RepID=UPI002598F411|nr:heparin lyase I family protein [uncultured Zobellia sp.]